MLDVCFNDSTKASLTLAQNCGKDIIGGAFSVITDKKWPLSYLSKRKILKEHKQKQIDLQKKAVPLGGKKEDVVSIAFGLSNGDIKSPITAENCPRKDYIYSTFSFNRYNEREDMEQSINDFWRSCIADLAKLQSAPEKVRIWLDQTPDAQCGLLFICDLLKDSETAISVVPLPEKIQRDDKCIMEYHSWGEMEHELFGTFLDREKPLTKDEINELSQQWQKLTEANAPLRVVENSVVISAGVDYYDDLIRAEFPEKACKIANIIGCAIGGQNLLISDVFIAKRIQHFIDNGELTVLDKDDNRFYGTVVRRS